MSKKIIFALLALIFLAVPTVSFARENVTDWYIKDFDSQIIVNNDSSLDITEKITADCGFAQNKHGIFRILPTRIVVEGKKIQMPVELIDITNEKGQKYQFQSTTNYADGTITWKIGDPNTAVQGVNIFVIHYKIQNAIRFDNQNFDELYWNLNGNFWNLQTDKFHATIKFPAEVTDKNSAVDFYTGIAGSKEKNLAVFKWSSPNVLEFDSTKTLFEKQGITASITFPKNIFTPYKPGFWQQYSQWLYFLIPLTVFLICFLLWKKYGDDPDVNKTIIAEYAPPGELSPVEMGMLMKSGGFGNSFITAEIIWLATRGLISIREIEDKILFFSNKDYELTQKHDPKIEETLNSSQQKILQGIFKSGSVVKVSSLKNKFFENLVAIKKAAKDNLKKKGLLQTTGINLGTGMRVITPIMLWLAFAFADISFFLAGSLVASAIILFAFSFIMPKRTLAGAELNWQIKGFKLFMETVDKDRAEFYEKENIFEKCLPYAILFGMTKIWIQKMQEIYGEGYWANHAPIWYAGNLSSFDTESFAGAMDKLSSDIAASTASPSGSGGSGFSGGGGGGGGGGGW